MKLVDWIVEAHKAAALAYWELVLGGGQLGELLEELDHSGSPGGVGLGAAPSDPNVGKLKKGKPFLKALPPRFVASDPSAGWLGTLIAHGLACQTLIMKYMHQRNHISWDTWLSGGSWGDVKTKNFQGNDERFAFKFAEFPPPVCFPGRYVNDRGASGSCPGNSWGIFLSLTGKNDTVIYNRLAYCYNNNKPISDLIVSFNEWADASPDRFSHMYFDLWADYPKRYKGKVKIPSEYSDNHSTYFRRLARYYMHGRWLVWCAEMARIHCRMGAGKWWEQYALSWGIGVADKSRRKDSKEGRSTLMDIAPDLQTDYTNTKIAMKRLILHVPPPGSIPSGSELDQSPRRLCDWPFGAEDYAPRWLWPSEAWKDGIRSKAEAAAVSSPALKAYLYIAGAVMSIAGAQAGGGLGGLVGGAISSVTGSLVQNGVRALIKYANQAFTGKAWDIDSISALLPADGADLAALLQRVVSRELPIEAFHNQLDGLSVEGWSYGDDLLGLVVDAATVDQLADRFKD